MEGTAVNRQQLIGGAIVFLGAILFSAKAVIVKLAYRYEIDSISLLALRFSFALPFYLFANWYLRRRTLKPSVLTSKDWFQVAFVGIIGYYLASLLDFLGLQYITASMERLILFLYPTIVVLISYVFLKKPIQRNQVLALILTYIGIGLAFYQGLQLSGQPNFALGGILVFLCAIAYAFYLIGSGELIPKMGAIRFTALALSFSSIAILLHHLLVYQWDLFHFHPMVYFYSFIMAVIATVIPSFMVSEGIRRIGASNASIVGSVGPISTIILAYIFLGERLGNLQILGTVIVIGGVLVITLSKKR
ncbi:MAG: DMT family transporter [Saprospiraceae bacterium]